MCKGNLKAELYKAISKMPNGPISASGLNHNDKRIQGFEGSSDFTRQKNKGNKQISDFEQKMLNYRVFSFDIYPPIFCGGFDSLFDIMRFSLVGP